MTFSPPLTGESGLFVGERAFLTITGSFLPPPLSASQLSLSPAGRGEESILSRKYKKLTHLTCDVGQMSKSEKTGPSLLVLEIREDIHVWYATSILPSFLPFSAVI